METLYKMKKPKTGQADRTMRAKLKGTASKTNRADLLDSKRRIPLSVVQPLVNQMPGKFQSERIAKECNVCQAKISCALLLESWNLYIHNFHPPI